MAHPRCPPQNHGDLWRGKAPSRDRHRLRHDLFSHDRSSHGRVDASAARGAARLPASEPTAGSAGGPDAGTGRRPIADYLGDESLKSRKFRSSHPDRWRLACDAAATDVYAFEDWNSLYRRAFGERLPLPPRPRRGEKDGIRYRRKGEGPNHKALRLWVKDNPGAIRRAYAAFSAETEFVLDSADRVDVVYRGPNSTVAIEVKSCDSDLADLRRGVFQCIKYRAVMEAMDIRADPNIIALLVTQTSLPGDLQHLLRRHDIGHFKAPAL